MSNNTLLPKSYQTELMLGLEEVLREFESLPVDVIKDFWNPQRCREDLLPYLALYLGVNQWDSKWDIKQKRAVCQNALLVNKQKGTLFSLKEALKSLNINATVVEWCEDAMDPNTQEPKNLKKGTAEINLHENDIIYSEEQYKVIYRLVNEVKRLSLLLSFRKTNSIKGDLKTGTVLVLLNKINLPFTPLANKNIEIQGNTYIGASFNFIHRINIGVN